MHAGSSPASAWPSTPDGDGRVRVDVRVDADAWRAILADDVRRGLTAPPRRLPPKYFYDAAGAVLFERITRLPEYYLTRTERAILEAHAATLMRTLRPVDVVEIGAGTASKIRPLLRAAPAVRRYIAVDVAEATIGVAATELVRAFPKLEVHAVIGDFEQHLAYVPPPGARRLVAFLGSTLGNLEPPSRQRFLRDVRHLLGPDGRLLLGLDLVKDAALLRAAYDDAAGVTAAFNRNVLHVINRMLGADFVPDAFRHVVRVDEDAARVEMHLVADGPQEVHVAGLRLGLDFAAGEGIWTESAYKFTRPGVEMMLVNVGLVVEHWLTDPESRFGLVVAAIAS